MISKCLRGALWSIMVATASWGAQSSDTLQFQDTAAEVMLVSLQEVEKDHFLRRLYERLLYVPLWVDKDGLTPLALALFDRIKSDPTLEKDTKLYQDTLRLEKMAHALPSTADVAQKIALEFKISQLYEGYATYAIYGSINWGAFLARLWNKKTEDVHADWVLHKPPMGPIDTAEAALLEGDLNRAFEQALPHHFRYRALQKELGRYIQIKEKGGWQKVALSSSKLKPGGRDKGVVQLRERLAVTGDLDSASVFDRNDTRATLYDEELTEALKRFQRRNGLKDDGVIGPATLRALNRSVEDRILALRLNLDRIKWLRRLEAPYRVIVNIPDFRLYIEQEGKLLDTIRVVVGKRSHPTPIFSDTMETVVLNPYWNIPKRIVQNEMIPKLMRNPYALKKKGIEIYSGWGAGAKPIDPATVDWSKYRYSKHVPYRFAQLPGKRNALGKVKFLFPNEFSVYMHDTPAKSLFRRAKRAYSHGCIRLGKPIGFLHHIADYDPKLSFEKAKTILDTKKNQHYFKLQKKVPVDIIYLTAYVDYEGKLQFREDVYGYDAMQLQAYRKW